MNLLTSNECIYHVDDYIEKQRNAVTFQRTCVRCVHVGRWQVAEYVSNQSGRWLLRCTQNWPIDEALPRSDLRIVAYGKDGDAEADRIWDEMVEWVRENA